MKFQMLTLPTIPATDEERVAKRPIGRNTEHFQRMLDELREIVVFADQAGFDVFSTTEHHFHSEGFEASPQPMMLYADLAARTERISFAPLSLVLPANDPIRVAEQIAMLDQLTRGRVYGGYARGYQDRWINVLGQNVPVQATPMDGSEADKRNRRVHEEYMQIVEKAWTDDLLQFNGEFYQVPFPYDTGITRWPASKLTLKYGHPGELDENGVIRGVSVIPRPYQDPHPQTFHAFSVSESTILNTARTGSMPMILSSYPDDFKRLAHLYQDTAIENGRQLKLGQNIGAVRAVVMGDSQDKVNDILRRGNFRIFDHYFSNFGFWEAFRLPSDEEKWPFGKVPLPPEELTQERLTSTDYALVGSVDEVKRKIERLQSIHGDGGELEWFSWFFDQGMIELDEAKRQLELFAEHIIPEFKD
jgi:alkanesulfonate monooxygenase SsuD/methylene tetrahydromethanopterin reductase-like flavin-dependent oxidoreductase (luciferase family)